MTPPSRLTITSSDPLLAAVELGRPVNPKVLEDAANYRDNQIAHLMREIEVLKIARARLLNQPQ